jgi:hypothetical protein
MATGWLFTAAATRSRRRRGRVEVNPDDANEAELIEVLNQFCSGFARRDPEAVVRVCAPDLDRVVVTSEEPLLRGPTELRRFLDRYVEGEMTYSWEWDRYEVSTTGRSHGFSPREPRSRRVSIA